MDPELADLAKTVGLKGVELGVMGRTTGGLVRGGPPWNSTGLPCTGKLERRGNVSESLWGIVEYCEKK